MNTSVFTILDQQEFLDDFAKEASKAHKKVFTQVMDFVADEFGGLICNIFIQKIPKDIEKRITYDAYSDLMADKYITLLTNLSPFSRNKIKNHKHKREVMLRSLKDAGVKIVVTNPPKGVKERLFPFIGRSHIKGTYVDDVIFYFHTFNFCDANIRSLDLCIKFVGKIAKSLIQELDNINNGLVKKDYTSEITDKIRLYFDSGHPGQSLILNKAIELVKEAKTEIKNCSDLLPDGPLADSFNAAYQKGVDLQIVTTELHPDFSCPFTLNNMFYLVNTRARLQALFNNYRYPLIFLKSEFAHAKLLIIDGSQAFVGSHNLNLGGVQAGTREWQLLINDKELVAALKARFNDFKRAVVLK